MAMPSVCFLVVASVCLLGIVIGSVLDFPINEALANKTSIGAFFATYGSYFSYCLYPAAGACLFVGLRKKGSRFCSLAWTLLIIGWFMAVYYSNSYNGSKVRELFGYVAGESAPVKSLLSWLFWVVLYAWVPPMLTDSFKNRSRSLNNAAFAFACVFVALYGYNRIHMTNHFLTDVCFGTLITCLIYAGISTAFMRAAEK